jgi:hypothetical protein
MVGTAGIPKPSFRGRGRGLFPPHREFRFFEYNSTGIERN